MMETTKRGVCPVHLSIKMTLWTIVDQNRSSRCVDTSIKCMINKKNFKKSFGKRTGAWGEFIDVMYRRFCNNAGRQKQNSGSTRELEVSQDSPLDLNNMKRRNENILN